jgi:hypothetical protein
MAENRPNRRGCAKNLRRKLETILIETRGKNQIEKVGCIGRENIKKHPHLGQTHCQNSVQRAVKGVQQAENIKWMT